MTYLSTVLEQDFCYCSYLVPRTAVTTNTHSRDDVATRSLILENMSVAALMICVPITEASGMSN